MTTETQVPFVLLPEGTFIDTSNFVAVTAEQAKAEKVDCFRRLWKETGLTLPELAAALGRPLGTITKYTHNGASSMTPPDHILEAMDRLVRERVRELAAARGYFLVNNAEAGLVRRSDIEKEWQDWVDSGGLDKLFLSRNNAARYNVEFRGWIEPDLDVDGRSA